MIELKHINKIYNGFNALNDISLTIKDGEICGIIGQSGAGKSTLVRCINMLEPPTSGDVIVNGRNMVTLSKRELRKERKKIGMIFQHFNLLSSRTVYDILELVGLADYRNKYPAQLSGGQKQRVGIARAIVSNPSVLLSDEATSALDPETVKSILQLLKDINKKLGITIVMITHQMEVIKEIAQHVAVIEHGKIIEEGSVINLFTNPQTETLKKFVGSVMSSELPAQLSHMNIHPTKEHESDNILISLSFRGDVTNEPIIAQLIKKYNLNVSILYGSIDYIQDISFGRLLIMISGHLEDLTDALTHLNALPITSEVIGYVSRNN